MIILLNYRNIILIILNIEIFIIVFPVSLKKKKYFCTDKMVVIYNQNFRTIIRTVIMVIDRNEYMEQLLAKRWNGKVKIVTGKDVPALNWLTDEGGEVDVCIGKVGI